MTRIPWQALELVRKAQLPVARADLKLGRVFYCWQSGMHTKFFPVQLIEDVPSRMQVRAPCVSRRTPPPSPRPIFFTARRRPPHPLPLVEQRIKCATLRPVDGATGMFEVDPDMPGTTGDEKKDYAKTALIFHVPGHVLRPVPNSPRWREIVN